MASNIEVFNGNGNVNTFIEKVNIYSAFKGHENEKKAQLVASYLDGAALDVYMRLSADEKKNPDTIKDEVS